MSSNANHRAKAVLPPAKLHGTQAGCYAPGVISVRVLAFGILKDIFKESPISFELPVNSTVSDLLAALNARLDSPIPAGIAIGVNAEFAHASQTLSDGDEVALLPPVSGGCTDGGHDESSDVFAALTFEPIDAADLLARSKKGDDGAAVVFDGVVRNQTRGRQVLFLDYETYEPMASRQLELLAREALQRFRVRHISVVHRLGRMEIGESSIVIVVASAHRAEAFDACRWLIDTIKKRVPIWKKETFLDGTCWADGEPFPDDISIPAP